jgi:hypothetical protein
MGMAAEMRNNQCPNVQCGWPRDYKQDLAGGPPSLRWLASLYGFSSSSVWTSIDSSGGAVSSPV